MSLDSSVATGQQHRTSKPSFKPLPADTSGSFKWFIEYDGQSCQLPDVNGLDYLNRILTARGTLVLGGSSGRDPEPAGAMTGRAIDVEIEKVVQRATLALSSGDRSTYDQAMVEVIALRKYRGQTIDNRGRIRRLSTPEERENKAIASAICRALEAIRKAGCPKIAAHLQANIKRGASGWRFTGRDKWNTGPTRTHCGLAPITEVIIEYHPRDSYVTDEGYLHTGTTYTEPVDATESLRRKWVAESTKRAYLSSLMRDVDPWWFPKPKR